MLALLVLCEVALAELTSLHLALFFLLAQELLVELGLIWKHRRVSVDPRSRLNAHVRVIIYGIVASLALSRGQRLLRLVRHDIESIG